MDKDHDQYGEFDDDLDLLDSGSDQVERQLAELFSGQPVAVLSEPVFDNYDEIVGDMDFSNITGGSFKNSFKKVNAKIAEKRGTSKRRSLVPPKPLSKSFTVDKKAVIHGKDYRKMKKVIVPTNRELIVQGVSKFILSDDPCVNALRSIGYWKGKRLNELLLTFNNDSAVDFNFSLFNPSMPLDYLQSTGQNINDKIQVAGGTVSYTDVLHNICNSPILVRNAKFIISGPSATAQRSVAMQVQDKYTNGITRVVPLNLSLQIDTMQVEGNCISFDLACQLNRAFIPDGMDVIEYTILAGNTVTMCFYYEQKSLKKLFYAEARERKPLLI